MTDVCKILGENIRKARKIRNLTQSELAELLEMEVKSLSLIETGKGFVSAKTLDKLSTILKISPEDLFRSNDKEDSEKIYSQIISNLEFIKNNTQKLKAVDIVVKNLL